MGVLTTTSTLSICLGTAKLGSERCEPSALRLLRSTAKNGSTPRRTRGSAVHHQFDGVNVGRIIGSKEKHGFGDVFRLPPTTQRNCGRDELCQLGGVFCGNRGARSALPNRSLRRARRDDIHA